MPLDPLIQAIFEATPQLANSQFWRMSPDEAREEFRRLCQFANPSMPAIGRTEHLEATGPEGPIPMRLYVPVAAGGDALPVIAFFHGGGFVVGDLDSYDALCRSLANESGCALISVDYRLAPEHKFPAGLDDCMAALSWVEANAPALGVDANRIAVAGDSAGANLAAVCCLIARDKGKPHIGFQLLIYPPTSFVHDSPSAQAFGAGFALNQATLEWCTSHYIPKDADRSDFRLSPSAAKELRGLPPAYIVTAGFDPLHDEGSSYADRLRDAGVAVAHVDYPSMIHGFLNMQGLVPLAAEAIAAAGKAVRAALE